MKFDVGNGKSNWNIFDKNYHYIKIYTDKTHEKYDKGYHAFFNAEYSEDIVLYPELVSKEVCITFEFIEDLDNRGIEFVSESANWNVEIAYNWLVGELLPKVLGKRNTNKILNTKKTDFMIRSNVFERVDYVKNHKISDIKDLYKIISVLQRYYNINPHNIYRIKKQDFIGIYNSIELCLFKSKKADLHYICSKLRLSKCNSNKELIEYINGLNESIEDTTINGFGLDYLFRALLMTLKSNGLNLSLEDLPGIGNNINFFLNLHDREIMLNKYAHNFNGY